MGWHGSSMQRRIASTTVSYEKGIKQKEQAFVLGSVTNKFGVVVFQDLFCKYIVAIDI